MSKNKVITPDMVDWNAYKRDIEQSLANERLWGLGGSVLAEENIERFEEENIERFEEELYLIENENYDELLSKYDDDVWRDYLK